MFLLMFLYKPKFWIYKVFFGTTCIFFLNCSNMDVCVTYLYICFDKKTRFFFNPSRGGVGYFKGILWTSTKSTLHYYELNNIFWFSLIIFFHLGGRRRTCFVPGCRPPPGTSRFKFPKNKKKKKLLLNSLKIDETNEIGDSRVCSLHFTKSDLKPNCSISSAKLSEISPARKFFQTLSNFL